MRLTKRITLLPALLFMVVCAYGLDVHYDYDRSANFAAYNTYQSVDLPGGMVADQLIDQAIKRAVDEQLAQKRSHQGRKERGALRRLPCRHP